MSEYVYIDGLVISEEGEIIDLPEGCLDKAAFLAQRHRDAAEREKGWTEAKQALSRALVKLFPEDIHAVKFGELVASLHTRSTKNFDGRAFSRELAAMELPKLALIGLLSYATGFDTAQMEKDRVDLIKPVLAATSYATSAPWVQTKRVLDDKPPRKRS